MTDDVVQPRGKNTAASSGNRAAEHDIEEKRVVDNGLDSEAQAHIGRQLKAMYDDVVNQPIPDKIKHLLDQLNKPAISKKSLPH